MSRQASCTSLATRSIAASFLPLKGAKSMVGSSLALAQRPRAGAAKGCNGSLDIGLHGSVLSISVDSASMSS